MNPGRHMVGAALLLAVLAVLGSGATAVAQDQGTDEDGQSATTGTGTETGTETGSGAGYGRMMLVLDSSGSMAEPAGGGQTKIAAAKTALRDVIGALPDEAQVGLRVFGATVFSRNDPGACEDTQAVVPPGVGNRDELLSAIDGYKPYGETPIPQALREAAGDLGSEGARSIVLVSDGESTCQPDPCQVASELADQGIDLKVDVVGLSVSGKARDQLRCIAERGNGTYYDARDAADIEGKLSRVAERALRPFTLTGTPITGGTESDPTPLQVGDWVDTLGPRNSESGSKSYVVERSTEGSTLRVSAISQGQPGDEGLRIELYDEEGDRCDDANAIRQIDARDIVGVQAVAAEENECAAAGAYTVTVSRRLGDEQDVPFGLRVTEEPPIEDPGFEGTEAAEVAPPQVSGAETAVVGGASFANAAPIGAGRWSSTVVPGEALMYRFDLDYGQAARVRVTYPKPTAAAREVIGLFPPFTQITAYNPMQAQLESPEGAKISGRTETKSELALLTATPAVSRSLLGTRGFNGVADYSAAGSYYLGVSMQRQDYSIEFPFTIDVEIVGEPQPGPTYADGVTWSVADGSSAAQASGSPSPEPEATDAAEEPATEAGEDSDGSSPARLVAGTVAGVAGVAVIAAAFLLWRRRRAA